MVQPITIVHNTSTKGQQSFFSFLAPFCQGQPANSDLILHVEPNPYSLQKKHGVAQLIVWSASKPTIDKRNGYISAKPKTACKRSMFHTRLV